MPHASGTRRNFLYRILCSFGIGGIGTATAEENQLMETERDNLNEIAQRYPEKSHFLGQIFNNTTNSYKLVWFLAILSLLKNREDRELSLNEIFTEMVVIAWHPVCLYLLSLGRQDKLQDIILDIKNLSGLPANAEASKVRDWINNSEECQVKLDFFRRYVPTRFLTPWFSAELRGVKDDLKRTKMIADLAAESQSSRFPSPYYFNAEGIVLSYSWMMFFKENFVVMESFGEHNLSKFLQARNPSIPGIINKLAAPTSRQLTAAREFWVYVREDFNENRKGDLFVDIYTDRRIQAAFSIDHFLPWSYVAHDLFWNLTPVEKTTNSRKGNNLPDLDLYLPKLARLHYQAILSTSKRPKLLEDYLDCFKIDVAGLIGFGEQKFIEHYREVIAPQTQIAINQGFQQGWKFADN